jgi:hypothetical protein
MVIWTCYPSYNRKPKIGGSQSNPAPTTTTTTTTKGPNSKITKALRASGMT